jgi:hypothetical protein
MFSLVTHPKEEIQRGGLRALDETVPFRNVTYLPQYRTPLQCRRGRRVTTGILSGIKYVGSGTMISSAGRGASSSFFARRRDFLRSPINRVFSNVLKIT